MSLKGRVLHGFGTKNALVVNDQGILKCFSIGCFILFQLRQAAMYETSGIIRFFYLISSTNSVSVFKPTTIPLELSRR